MSRLCGPIIAGALLLSPLALSQETLIAGPEELVIDEMETGAPERWGAGRCQLTEIRQAGEFALEWLTGQGGIQCGEIPHDWTPFDALEMWIYSDEASDAVIAIFLDSDSPESEQRDYFLRHLRIDWQGWKQVVLPLRSFGGSWRPLGLDQIESIAFHPRGWEAVEVPGTVLTIDDLKLTRLPRGDEFIISDMEDDIQGWWRLTADAGDAKVGEVSGAWLDTVRQPILRHRTVPRDWSGYSYLCFWLSSAAANGAGLSIVVHSENPDTEQIDYYVSQFVIDWQGWREIVIPLDAMKRGRSPVGWHHITQLEIAAGRWGFEPRPDSRLSIDHMRLTKTVPQGQEAEALGTRKIVVGQG